MDSQVNKYSMSGIDDGNFYDAKFYIISDNNYFLQGLMSCINFMRKDVRFIQLPGSFQFSLIPVTCVLLLYITNIKTLKEVLSSMGRCPCRIIFMLKTMRPCIDDQSAFPWVISEKTKSDMLERYLFKASISSPGKREIPCMDVKIFSELITGSSVFLLSQKEFISEKTIYNRIQKVKSMFSLRGNGAFTILYGMRILSVCQHQ